MDFIENYVNRIGRIRYTGIAFGDTCIFLIFGALDIFCDYFRFVEF